MSKQLDVCLQLSLPKALEARVLDRMLQHPEWVGPFSTHRIEGHGDPEGIASPREQVRGRAERVQIQILMDGKHVAELLAELKADQPSRDILWWLSPVLDSGSFA